MADTASGTPAPEPNLLTPDNAVLLLVDHQPQMFFRVGSGDREDIINATVALAKAAKTFRLPTVLTTVAAGTFSGPLLPEVADLFSGQEVIDRTTMNPGKTSGPWTPSEAPTGRRSSVPACGLR